MQYHTDFYSFKMHRINQRFFLSVKSIFYGLKNPRFFFYFLPVKKITPVKNYKKPSKSERENHFLPVKFFENYTRENQIGAREK